MSRYFFSLNPISLPQTAPVSVGSGSGTMIEIIIISSASVLLAAVAAVMIILFVKKRNTK